jgi:hypothetical protein
VFVRRSDTCCNRAFNKYLAAIAAHDDATAVRIWNTVLSYLSEDDVASAAIAATAPHTNITTVHPTAPPPPLRSFAHDVFEASVIHGSMFPFS